MSLVLTSYLCADEPATIRKQAEDELRKSRWTCQRIKLSCPNA